MITAVIFDLDDTLYDEIDFCRSGFQVVAEHIAALSGRCSANSVFETIWTVFTTQGRGSTFDTALSRLGIPADPALIARLVEVYRTHTPAITLPDESRSVLEELQARYTLGLLTDGYLPTQQLKVQALDIARYFETIVYTEELGRACWKPSPVGFQRVLTTLNTRPEQAAYVADNETKDFIAPNRLGMLSIQVRRPQRLHRGQAQTPEAAPKHTIDTIGNLARILTAY